MSAIYPLYEHCGHIAPARVRLSEYEPIKLCHMTSIYCLIYQVSTTMELSLHLMASTGSIDL